MRFRELIWKLRQLDLDQVGRVTRDQDSSITIGKPAEVCFPYSFQCHTLYAPAGADDFMVAEEEVAALLRRFRIPRTTFDQIALEVVIDPGAARPGAV